MVGNGATDWDFDVSPSFPSIAYNFNLIPKKSYDSYVEMGCKVFFNDFIVKLLADSVIPSDENESNALHISCVYSPMSNSIL